ncbi:MAG TPA: AMP-binding protein, partial [Acidimicrobiales bacterium]|nr:AMP-binding protein [Acidimicrobiales bacterium]
MHPGAIAETTPHKPAVIMDDGRTLTYRELDEASNRLAHVFRDIGLRTGDHIAFVLENRPEFFVVAWAAQRAGLYYTATSTRLTADELGYIVDDCGAKVLVASAETVAAASAIDAPKVELRILLDGGSNEGWERYDELVADRPGTPIADQAEGADMLYSSGTTGRPKGVKPPLPEGDSPMMSAVGML